MILLLGTNVKAMAPREFQTGIHEKREYKVADANDYFDFLIPQKIQNEVSQEKAETIRRSFKRFKAAMHNNWRSEKFSKSNPKL